MPNLSSPGAMALYFTCEFYVLQKFIRQIHALKQPGLQGHQLFSQALQGLVFLLFLGSAFMLFPFSYLPYGYNPLVAILGLILYPNSCSIYPIRQKV